MKILTKYYFSCRHILCMPRGGKGKLNIGTAWRRKGN
jgi:ribosomal protein S27E